MGTDLINELQAAGQTKNLGVFNSMFDPNYSNRVFTEDIIDPSISTALSTQFDPITKQLENARVRGQLNETGYEGAQKEYGNRYSAAKGSVQSIARDILNADRGELDTYLGSGRAAAGSTPLGTNFDVSQYQTGADNIVNRNRESFGNELSSALGDTKYVDLQDLMNAGGAAQGPYDPMAGGGVPGGVDPAVIAAEANRKNKGRGLGTQGVY
jgi:hypothetical protein